MRTDKFDKVAERVYNASFVITVILVFAASVGTAIARYSLNANIELVPDNVFKFIKEVLWIFALPVSIKIVGDSLPLIVQGITAWKGLPIQSGFGMQNVGVENFQPNSVQSNFQQDRMQGQSHSTDNTNTYY